MEIFYTIYIYSILNQLDISAAIKQYFFIQVGIIFLTLVSLQQNFYEYKNGVETLYYFTNQVEEYFESCTEKK